MTHDLEGGVTVRSRFSTAAPDQVDRILVIACVVIWLAALGAGVAAIVALVDLSQVHTVTSGDSNTPWLLYSVIGVSAAVIICAIPLLVRARRTASTVPSRSASQGNPGGAVDAPSVAQRLQPFGAPVLRRTATPPATGRVGFPTAAVDQIWLRCTASIAGAMGAAATGIGVATYLMASGHDTAAWIVYGVAAVIAVAMPVAAWFYLRQLHGVLDAS
ncbi:MAG: hypothetical protein QOI01_1737 [Mycobacterium sp.]|jgi:hypothetical protein|nr:hypothetical protein [Mycobacterium sp.]